MSMRAIVGVPTFPTCRGVATGDSRDEVAQLIREAIEFHIEGMREEGLPIPETKADAERVDIAT